MMKTISMIKNLRLLYRKHTVILFIVGLLFIFGCVVKQADPTSLEITEMDKEVAKNPPTPDELMVKPRILLPLIVLKDETVTKTRLDRVLSFLHREFEAHGNFSVISQDKVDTLLSSDQNRRFQASNVADAIELGKSLNASFIAQYQILIGESKIVDSIDHYKANINITIFTTDSGQVVFKKDIVYDSQEQEESILTLKNQIQEYFQLRGFILETRGGKQYAKISLGRSLGIKIGREFQVREREVKNEMVAGMARRIVSFPPLSLATVKVVLVAENESWVEIDMDDQSKIKKGQVVFSLPESETMF